MSSQCRAAVGIVVVMLVLAANPYGTTRWPRHRQADAQPATGCMWRELPVQIPARYHGAAVFDSIDRRLYYYGGLDAGGSPSAAVFGVDFSDLDIEKASLVSVPIEGQQPAPRWGHSGVFLPTDGDPIVYWIAGQQGGRFEPTATPITPRPVRTDTPTPRPT